MSLKRRSFLGAVLAPLLPSLPAIAAAARSPGKFYFEVNTTGPFVFKVPPGYKPMHGFVNGDIITVAFSERNNHDHQPMQIILPIR